MVGLCEELPHFLLHLLILADSPEHLPLGVEGADDGAGQGTGLSPIPRVLIRFVEGHSDSDQHRAADGIIFVASRLLSFLENAFDERLITFSLRTVVRHLLKVFLKACADGCIVAHVEHPAVVFHGVGRRVQQGELHTEELGIRGLALMGRILLLGFDGATGCIETGGSGRAFAGHLSGGVTGEQSQNKG